MLRASIDIGSNSILLLAAVVEDGKITKELLNLSEVTALGKDLDKTKVFCQPSMDDSFTALKKYKIELEKINFPVAETLVTATEASRVAKNSAEFFSKVKTELGFSVTIISSQGEAYYSSLGAAIDITQSEAVIMDIGGASTELIKITTSPFKVKDFISMPFGSVRGTDWLNDNSFFERVESIFKEFAPQLKDFKAPKLYCVAGTMTSVANMFHNKTSFDEQVVHGTVITLDKFLELIENHKMQPSEKLLEKYPFLGKRARTIIAGSLVGYMTARKIESTELEISTYGLRYGTLISGSIKNEFIFR